MKKILSIFACLMAILVLALTGCGNDEKPSKAEELENAINATIDFLNNVKESGNHTSVSEYSDGRVYKFYTEDGKIKVEYNGIFYGLKTEDRLYKISQADDMTWRKHTDTTDLSDPITRNNNLLNTIYNISRYSLWTDYNSKTKTLTATLSDGTETFKLDAGMLIITYNLETGITTHTIKDVGNTTVTLPENIIDDTQK